MATVRPAGTDDGDTAWAVVDMHLRKAVNGNLTASFPGHFYYQVDGNLGITAAICEMVLQSQTGEIELLPALPRAWPAGTVRGLPGPRRVRGLVLPLSLPSAAVNAWGGDASALEWSVVVAMPGLDGARWRPNGLLPCVSPD